MGPNRSLGLLGMLGALIGLGGATSDQILIDDARLGRRFRSPLTPRQVRARAKAKRGRAMRKLQRRLERARS